MSVDYKSALKLCNYNVVREVWGLILENPSGVVQFRNYLNHMTLGGINRIDCWPLRAVDKREPDPVDVTVRGRCLFVQDPKVSRLPKKQKGWFRNTSDAMGITNPVQEEHPKQTSSLIRVENVFVPSSTENRASSLKKIFSEGSGAFNFLIFFMSDTMNLEEALDTKNYLYQLLRSYKLRGLALHLVVGNRNKYVGSMVFDTWDGIEKYFNLNGVLDKIYVYFSSKDDWVRKLNENLYKNFC